MKYIKAAIVALLLVVVAAEASVRIAGLADVPVRSANPTTGYIPLANQSGRFLLNDWTINNLSMISRKTYPGEREPIIVAGDSVVFGGNPLAQSERVGERLDAISPFDVFAIADGSWSFKNELAYFISSKKLIGSPKKIVFVLNSADFDAPSSWRCNSTHPTSSPVSHLYFAVRKYAFPDCEASTPSELVVKDPDLVEEVNKFLDDYRDTDVSIVLYPTTDEFKSGESFRGKLTGSEERFSRKIKIVDLVEIYRGDASAWNLRFYKDEIHPNAEGAAALANFIHKYAF
ncbi:hypothetical protein [Rhodomicrobium sp.]|uniref:hypothetical protein n=1 Tax=Rhodomicrobium sp. TaxID=2720632 RepID=UPI0039E5690C